VIAFEFATTSLPRTVRVMETYLDDTGYNLLMVRAGNQYSEVGYMDSQGDTKF
jgi:hypothetical protein